MPSNPSMESPVIHQALQSNSTVPESNSNSHASFAIAIQFHNSSPVSRSNSPVPRYSIFRSIKAKVFKSFIYYCFILFINQVPQSICACLLYLHFSSVCLLFIRWLNVLVDLFKNSVFVKRLTIYGLLTKKNNRFLCECFR